MIKCVDTSVTKTFRFTDLWPCIKAGVGTMLTS